MNRGGYHPLTHIRGVDITPQVGWISPPGGISPHLKLLPPTGIFVLVKKHLLPFVNLSLRFHVNVFTINQLDLLMVKIFQANFSFWYRIFMVSVSSYNQNQLEACCCIKMVIDFEALMMKKLGGGKSISTSQSDPCSLQWRSTRILSTSWMTEASSHLFPIPHICHFWYATIFFRPVKGTLKKCVSLRQKLHHDKTV